MNIKNIILCLVFSISLINPAHAYDILNPPKPIFFDRAFLQGIPKPGIDSNSQNPYITPLKKEMRIEEELIRHNSITKEFIIMNTPKRKLKPVKRTKLQKQIGIYVSKYSEQTPKYSYQPFQGYFLFNNSNIGVGYCLIEILDATKSLNAPEPNFLKIIALPLNNSYLNDKLSLPKGVTVTFHERDVNGFIERYGFVEISSYKLLMLDAFYPKEMEKELQQKIIKRMNNNILVFSNTVMGPMNPNLKYTTDD